MIRELRFALACSLKNDVEFPPDQSLVPWCGRQFLNLRGINLMRQSFAVGIGGAAGQGVATPGDIFCKDLQPPRPASERLQRLPVHHPRRPHFSHHPHRPGQDHQHGRPPRPADPPQSGHHGPPPRPAHRRRCRASTTQTRSSPVPPPTASSSARFRSPSWPTSHATR